MPMHTSRSSALQSHLHPPRRPTLPLILRHTRHRRLRWKVKRLAANPPSSKRIGLKTKTRRLLLIKLEYLRWKRGTASALFNRPCVFVNGHRKSCKSIHFKIYILFPRPNFLYAPSYEIPLLVGSM
ncbi:ATP synthase complex subunit h domain [Histoplasma capsulatum var. duboisii H88]|uniref:ATP synthase complex subunit h domain n=1 Tax=Ajellomyces capsulatus (strain H88) TaxID=544711 RepID=A0A8A1LJF2_AJEC8|nr:ATP synthase complex subunit h domain [Histoplasma capsulatum var. duboisii H88]